MLLLTPGPCMTSETVRQAAAMPDLNHREPAFQEIFEEVRARLLNLYAMPEHYRVCVLGGSGTAAVEAMVSSCVGAGRCLVITSGYYSARLYPLLQIHQIPGKVIAFGWREAWNFKQIEEELSSDRYEAVLCVHNETTTGRLNDVNRLGALCRRHGVRCLVDAMSSFGVEHLDFSVLDAVASSSNKCLHGTPGVSFVFVFNELILEMLPRPSRTYYLDLTQYITSAIPLTPPVPAIASLRQALREMDSVAKRRASYEALSKLIRQGLQKRNFEPAIPLEESSITLTTYRAPNGDAADWILRNRDRGFLLYGCKGELEKEFFQVANMGELKESDIEDWLKVVDELR